MSVLLTATAAKNKFKKKLKNKPGSVDSGTSSTAGPPGTNEVTIVWYWLLNGVETTVMYNRGSSEIWCNGSTVSIQPRLDPMLGHVYDFIITLPETQSCHQGNLVYMDDGRYILYVDSYAISEYYSAG